MSTPSFPISPELGQLLALRRVRRGHVALIGNGLLIDHERPVPDYVREPLHDLLNDGHLYLGDERTGWAQWPVLTTESGQHLLAKLEELRTSPRRHRTIQ